MNCPLGDLACANRWRRANYIPLKNSRDGAQEGQRVANNNNPVRRVTGPRLMRPNNRQRSRGGRNGGGGGGGGGHNNHHKPQHHNPNRPPNRNQMFDSSGPDVRVRGNAHQVFDKYQALAREAETSGDRIQAEAYWQYADHYFRMIQTMGGFGQRNNVGYGDEEGGQTNPNPQQQGQPGGQQSGPPPSNANGHAPGERMGGRGDDVNEADPGLGGVAFLQNGRSTSSEEDPAVDDQPEVPAFTPPAGRRGG